MGWNKNAWFTWQGQQTPRPSLEDCRDSCIANAVEAAEKEARLQRLHDSLPPGDARLVGSDKVMPLRHQVGVAKIEQAHWRRMAANFETWIATAATRPRPLPVPPAPPPLPRARLPYRDDDRDELDATPAFAQPAEDPALVREQGADDVEEGEDWRSSSASTAFG